MGLFPLQPSMGAGEISPLLYGRVDLAKFAAALKTCRNFVVLPQGGAENRPGTEFVTEVKDSTKKTRLRRFHYNDSQTYVLEFGDLYMRVIKRDDDTGLAAYVVYPPGDPSEGDPVEIVTPFVEDDLATLQGAQDADVIFMAHQNYAPRKLARTQHYTWTLTAQDFAPDIAGPAGITVVGSAGGAEEYRYKVTATDADTGEESYSGYETGKSITGATAANPVELTVVDHGYEDGDEVIIASVAGMIELNGQTVEIGGIAHSITAATKANPVEITLSAAHGMVTGEQIHITGVGGMTEINDLDFTITVTSTTKVTLGVDGTLYGVYTTGGTATRNDRFTLPDVDGSAYTAYSAPHTGTVARIAAIIRSTAALSGGATNTLTWSVVANAQRYDVYREENGIYGWIGGSEQLTFVDDNIAPDLSEGPPRPRNPFSSDWPAVVGFHGQRIAYANTPLYPSVVFWSRPTLFENFTVSEPVRDDSAITERLTSHTVNTVRHLVAMRGLVAITNGPDFLISSDGPVAPGSLRSEPHGYRGASTVPPVVIGSSILYAQDRGNLLWDIAYTLQSEGLEAVERSILAAHLFKNKTIVAMDFQRVPVPVLWIVLDDGALVGMTYLKEHDIYAFHQHDSAGGLFEDVVVVPEGEEDRVYFVVQRTVDGSSVRYIERLSSRQWTDQEDAKFLDCSLSYDSAPAQTFSGLDHLEGETVYALADGWVIGPLTVESGAVDLGDSYSTVTIGLLYTQDIQTLDLDIAEIRGRKRRVIGLNVLLHESRRDGLQGGPSEDELVPFEDRDIADAFDVPELFSGYQNMSPIAGWEDQVGTFIRNTLPLPVTILSILPELDVG